MDDREMSQRWSIIRCPVGSVIHGLNVPGKDDRDEMAVCVEDVERTIGFSPFEQYIYRTAAEREGKQDAPSQAGDLDLTIYSLRKFLRLAIHGNPSILNLLFVPWDKCSISTSLGSQLQELAPYIISKQAGHRYLGYLEAQRQRILGERGQKKVNRPELEEKYGFDTKYAMHILRLGYQGVELLSTGRISLPMPEKHREFVYDVRLGKVELQDVLTKAGELETEIKDLISDGPIRERADEAHVEAWMCNVYLQCWKSRLISTPFTEEDVRRLNAKAPKN